MKSSTWRRWLTPTSIVGTSNRWTRESFIGLTIVTDCRRRINELVFVWDSLTVLLVFHHPELCPRLVIKVRIIMHKKNRRICDQMCATNRPNVCIVSEENSSEGDWASFAASDMVRECIQYCRSLSNDRESCDFRVWAARNSRLFDSSGRSAPLFYSGSS